MESGPLEPGRTGSQVVQVMHTLRLRIPGVKCKFKGRVPVAAGVGAEGPDPSTRSGRAEDADSDYLARHKPTIL